MFEDLGQVPAECEDALRAIADLTGRAGAQSFEVGSQYPELPYERQSWWCSAFYAGARLTVDGQPSVTAAADGLARRLLDGGECQGCGKQSFVQNDAGYRFADEAAVLRARRDGVCRWQREGVRWSRACGDRAPAGSSREKLAEAMARCGVIPAEQIAAAREGRYDDYLSEFALPTLLLVQELEPYGDAVAGLVAQVKAGAFDGTAAESRAWMQSAEGQAALAELVRGVPEPGRGKVRVPKVVDRNQQRKKRKRRR